MADRNKHYIAAIDQGTTSTRCLIFDERAELVGSGQFEHEQIFPQPGWVEHNALEIWDNTRRCVAQALAEANIARESIAAVGITNQRETTVVWNKVTGQPISNAIVWQDTRTRSLCQTLLQTHDESWIHERTGLFVNSYSSGPKLKWLLDNIEGARDLAERGELLFGTIDSWLLWNLSGGAQGDNGQPARHATDVTNASRTLLMNIQTLEWDEELCQALNIPMQMLPEIRPSVSTFGHVRQRGTLGGTPITGILGDQQAALFGQAGFHKGDIKSTYGTGLFLLMNTGKKPLLSSHGLITTVSYQIERQKPHYALEGSVAMGGALVQWLRDNLGTINSAGELEDSALKVSDNGGVYIVPAFSGLFAPRWESEARGIIVGLTRFANKHHLSRAVIEATAYQTRDLIEAMRADSNQALDTLKVDGGMVHNDLLMQFQADISGMEVHRPQFVETTALGAAFAAGLGVGIFDDLKDLHRHSSVERTFKPKMTEETAKKLYRQWNRAVERSLDWEE
ncbi:MULTISPECIES: glycerol kinase GlpK [unclassified Corynebacterium]|uniref:glycerol kinase GlpK n=1 Tax=unclassified Corynebacterium TaxID=2624378 RepID=UPI0021685C03|nr:MULTISPECIES: glycerol kinase GlpK [unclassified Corynebacterium]MCS4489382.1 glycerol kinase GlpK [Corynebacterium sp. ES2775-CONJ]MCS4491195.1 glycerol kinase GlpK [Corynebacterium sp. ES2715-CONJ3]MCS4530924.1 glycerol kinase GlpK [Corynebacterium sp. ES2730-CONJ]